jgi:enoyl-CoA hydratase/carnithine racemase
VSDVEIEDRGAVRIITINRPEVRNALNGAVLEAVGTTLMGVDADPGVRAVIITAAGDRAFCAGADLKERATGQSSGSATDFVRFRKEGIATPVIAAVNGLAFGGGFELVLACDMVVAAEHATFALPEVKRGLYPFGGGIHLGTRIPLALALELGLTGDPIDARRAEALGLVNAVVPADQLIDAAIGLAERITANGPLGVGALKRLMTTAVNESPPAAEALNEVLMTNVTSSNDAKEGGLAFIEKRAPNWTGT